MDRQIDGKPGNFQAEVDLRSGQDEPSRLAPGLMPGARYHSLQEKVHLRYAGRLALGLDIDG